MRGGRGGVKVADVVPGGGIILVGGVQVGHQHGAALGVQDANAGGDGAAVEGAGDEIGVQAGIDGGVIDAQEVGVAFADAPGDAVADGLSSVGEAVVPTRELQASGVGV